MGEYEGINGFSGGRVSWWQSRIVLIGGGILLLIGIVIIFLVMFNVSKDDVNQGPPPSPSGSEKFEIGADRSGDLDGQCTRYYAANFIGDRTCVGTLDGSVLKCAC